MLPIRAVFLALGSGMGMLIPFQAVVLSGKGFDAATIGLLLAAASAAGVVAGPIWGHLGDSVIGRPRVLGLASIGSAVALAVFGWSALPIVTALAWVAFSGLSTTLVPTSDAIAVNAVRAAGRGDFGRLRLLLSLGFGATAIASGFLYDVTGYGPAPFVAAGTFGFLLLASRFLPDVGRAATRRPGHPPADRRAGRGVRRSSRGCRWCCSPSAWASAGCSRCSPTCRCASRSWAASPSDVALASGLESMAEIPGFIVAGWLAKRVGLRVLFLGSALLMTGCGCLLAVLTEPALMIGVRLFTGTAYAGMTVASVLALAVLLPASLQATAQNLNAMVGGIAGIAIGLLGGVLLTVAGTPALFVVTSFGTLVAGFLALRVLPRERASGARHAGYGRRRVVRVIVSGRARKSSRSEMPRPGVSVGVTKPSATAGSAVRDEPVPVAGEGAHGLRDDRVGLGAGDLGRDRERDRARCSRGARSPRRRCPPARPP